MIATTYSIDGLPIAKYKIYWALDEAVFEEVTAPIVAQRVLCPPELAVVEGRHVTWDS